MPAARLELIAAQDRYEREAIGLAARFRAAVEVQVERIATNPLQFLKYYPISVVRVCDNSLTACSFDRFRMLFTSSRAFIPVVTPRSGRLVFS